MELKKYLLPVAAIAALITGIALYETQALSSLGKAGLVLGAFLTPSFFYGAYRLYERREHLKDLTESSTIMMREIKNRKKEQGKIK